MKLTAFAAFAAVIMCYSCTKTTVGTDSPVGNNTSQCAILDTIHARVNSPVNIGQTVNLQVPEVGGYRTYSWTGPSFFNSQWAQNSFTAELKNRGWYYVSVFKQDCSNTKTDSVYLDVKLNQGTPPCTKAANTASYNNQSSDNFTYCSKQLYSGSSLLTLYASCTTADVNVTFHPRWSLSIEPEDGIYTTTNTQSFDPGNFDKVCVSMVKSSIYWVSAAGQSVYISHVGGKLQARYCNLSMSGSLGGPGFTTLASANIIQP